MLIRQNYYLLFPGLMILILAGSASAEIIPEEDTPIIDLAFALALLLGVWGMVHNRAAFVLGWVLVVGESGLALAAYLSGDVTFRYLELVLALVFFSISSFITARDALLGGTIDMNWIIGIA